ncbi:Zn-dependent protease with chaperone function [Actinokineospora baliensis]|uniref:M48 family metalloprotease n=1 Tax=Actinokineospora baliensis TaxID=547056 RepID=UPI00195C623B|nr:M48 family metalloprotease [Actinokineospora baliensis]MBM7774616.1 Zn-dependent protease with chaperone function [Actinokineospora baliensis]
MTAPSTGPNRPDGVPAGTTTLFVLLIAAVLATTSTVYFGFNFAVPQVPWSDTKWMTLGLTVVTGIAGVHYLLHPWWMRRRAALVKLTSEDSHELIEELEELCRVASVRAPTFLLAPYATESCNGQAFGHARERMVRLDAGLVALRGPSPASFRAVVLHELAHLRNRDVDLTYLTVAIWRSFIVISAPLMVWQVLASRGSWWGDVLTGMSLTALTLVILLTRNALLRSRELYADARLTEWTDTEARQALHRAIARQAERSTPDRFHRRVWDDHPHPSHRLHAVNNQALLARPRLWELFAVGIVASTFLNNFYLYLVAVLEARPGIAPLLVIIPASVGVVGALVLAAARIGKSWRLLTAPTVLTAGYLVGESTSLVNSGSGTWVIFGQWGAGGFQLWPAVAAVGVLFVGVALLSAWSVSATKALTASGRSARFAVNVVSAVGAAALTPWLLVWWSLQSNATVTVSSVSKNTPPSLPDGLPDAYANTLRAIVDLLALPRDSVLLRGSVLAPGLVLGVVLLWLVPVVLASRARANPLATTTRRDAKRVLALSGAGTALFLVLLGVHLVVSRSAYDRSVHREKIAEWSAAVAASLDAATLVAQVLVAVAAALVAKRLRPAFALMAIVLVAMAAALFHWSALLAAGCYATDVPLIDDCWKFSSLATVGVSWHNKIVFGAVAAIPVVLVILALKAIARPTTHAAVEDLPPAQPLKPATLAGVSAAAAFLAVASALPGAGHWYSFQAVTTVDECVAGTWRETSGRRTLTLNETISILLTTAGERWIVSPDGTLRRDFGVGTAHRGEHSGTPVVITFVGTADYRYHIEDGLIHLAAFARSGSLTTRAGDISMPAQQLSDALSPTSTAKITCEADQLTVDDGNWRQAFERVKD